MRTLLQGQVFRLRRSILPVSPSLQAPGLMSELAQPPRQRIVCLRAAGTGLGCRSLPGQKGWAWPT